jgi:fatty-acyl-CoA synthase
MKVQLTVGDFLERAALVAGDRTAVVDEPDAVGGLGRISYTRLRDLARGMAANLDRLGIAAGERVAIVSPNSAKFLASLFGVSGFGRVLVPVNFRLNVEEVRYIIDHSGAGVVLIDPELDASLADITAKHRIVLDGIQDAELFSGVGDPEPWGAANEDFAASINYTSGTTARPKGVELTHRNCWLNAATFGWHTTVTDRDTYLHTLPTFHCNGWGLPYAITGMAGTHVIQRKIDGEEILARIEREAITMLAGAPAVVAMILDAASRRRERGEPVPGRDTVRMVVAGAPPPSKTIERVEAELGWEFIQIYGLTETAPLVTINRAPREWETIGESDRARRLSRAGVPALGVQVSIDESGEILTRSNNVFDGYWQQPDDTANAIVDGWFHTGDGGQFEGPYLAIVDRKKDVIISGGENVSSIEVEDALYQHPSVAEACVIGVPHEKWGETVKALVVRRDPELTEDELLDHCRARLAHYKCPTSIEFHDSFERTATGKLQKFKIRAPYWDGYERSIHG